METNASASGTAKRKSNKLVALAVRVLHNPTQIRVVMMIFILGGWHFVVYSPLSQGIEETTRRTDREKKRLGLANEVEGLRVQVGRFQNRLPEKTDPNEWVQYLLAGSREFPIRVAMIDPDGIKDVGPYKAIVVKMQIEGTFQDIDAFLRWIETNERLLRVDSLRMSPIKDSFKMDTQLVVLGVMG